ncbi:MAG: hypothetical protein ACPIG6_05420 [Akkermansiaceae bacterium]
MLAQPEWNEGNPTTGSICKKPSCAEGFCVSILPDENRRSERMTK